MGPRQAGGVMTGNMGGTRHTHCYSGWKQNENPAPLVGDGEGQGTGEQHEKAGPRRWARGPMRNSKDGAAKAPTDSGSFRSISFASQSCVEIGVHDGVWKEEAGASAQ